MTNQMELIRVLQQDQDTHHAAAATANMYYTIVVALAVITVSLMLIMCMIMRNISVLRSRMVACEAYGAYMREIMEILSAELDALQEQQNRETSKNLPNNTELLSVISGEVEQQMSVWGEKQKAMEKTNGLHFQKVIQECDKLRQHISVLRDADINLHKQYNNVVEKTDNCFVSVGMGLTEEVKYTTERRYPLYIDTNTTYLILNSDTGLEQIRCKIKYIVLSKILKHTQLQRFDITILMNFSFMLEENSYLVENLYNNRDKPQYIEIFQTAVKQILDKNIYILMPRDKEYSRNLISMSPMLAKHDFVYEI